MSLESKKYRRVNRELARLRAKYSERFTESMTRLHGTRKRIAYVLGAEGKRLVGLLCAASNGVHNHEPMSRWEIADAIWADVYSGNSYCWGNATFISGPCGSVKTYIDASIKHDCWSGNPNIDEIL